MTATDSPTFQNALDFISDEKHPLERESFLRYVRFFSDIAPARLKMFEKVWAKLSLARKHALLTHLKNEHDDDLRYSFEVLARPLLKDEDAAVRIFAIRLLEYCEEEDLIAEMLEIALNDPEAAPRAEAISLLGTYVYYGEMEEISPENLQTIENALLRIFQNEKKAELRQRAIEALGFSSREEVPALIKDAWSRDTSMWKASAVFAMGRSCDTAWEDEVLEGLLDESEYVRLAAAKAAGSLSLAAARPILLRLLTEENDEAVLRAVIWSLTEIGGEDVREYLHALLDEYGDDEDEQIAYIEDALDNLDFTEDIQNFDILNYDLDDVHPTDQ
jgi:HEAT repeat protein